MTLYPSIRDAMHLLGRLEARAAVFLVLLAEPFEEGGAQDQQLREPLDGLGGLVRARGDPARAPARRAGVAADDATEECPRRHFQIERWTRPVLDFGAHFSSKEPRSSRHGAGITFSRAAALPSSPRAGTPRISAPCR